MCDLEVASFLRRELRRGALSESDAGDVAARYLAMPIRIHGHRPLMERILDLRDTLTAYDAAYVALAELLKAPLATLDASVATVARGLGLQVVN